MPNLKTQPRRTTRLNLRTTERQKQLFERVAARQGKTVTDFILESAYNKAQEVLADERHFVLSPEKWKEFTAALDRPAQIKPRLRRLFAERTALEP
jgi:uncharacterized protein (DUF1778 family)